MFRLYPTYKLFLDAILLIRESDGDANIHEFTFSSYCSAMAVFSSCSSTAVYVIFSCVVFVLYLTVTKHIMGTAYIALY